MRVIKRKTQTNKIDLIKHKIRLYKISAHLVVHVLGNVSVHDMDQCLILGEDDMRYTGINLKDSRKVRMELNELSREQQALLVGEFL
jgi:hypothetical protein